MTVQHCTCTCIPHVWMQGTLLMSCMYNHISHACIHRYTPLVNPPTHTLTILYIYPHTPHPHSLSMPKEDFVMVQSAATTPTRMKRPQSSAFLGGRFSLPPFMSPSSTNLTHSQTGQNSSLVRMVSLCALL